MNLQDNIAWPADNLVRKPIAELVPFARNSRIHTPAQISQLAASIVEWGWTVPVLIDERGNLIAGHGRILAAHQLGITEVPCLIATGWSEAKRRAYVIADNRLTDMSTFDPAMLSLEMQDLQAMDYDLSLTGFDGEELLALLEGDGESDNKADLSKNEDPERQYAVEVTAASEDEQIMLIQKFTNEGLKCRALIF